MDDHLEPPLGVLEVAEMLGVGDRTVHQWQRRQRLPEKDGPVVNGGGTWWRSTILKWAGETGRLWISALRLEYADTYGIDPTPPMSHRPQRHDPEPSPPQPKTAAKKAPAKKAPAKKATSRRTSKSSRPKKSAAKTRS